MANDIETLLDACCGWSGVRGGFKIQKKQIITTRRGTVFVRPGHETTYPDIILNINGYWAGPYFIKKNGNQTPINTWWVWQQTC